MSATRMYLIEEKEKQFEVYLIQYKRLQASNFVEKLHFFCVSEQIH